MRRKRAKEENPHLFKDHMRIIEGKLRRGTLAAHFRKQNDISWCEEDCEFLKNAFDAGDKRTLLMAMYACTWFGRPVPEWVRNGFYEVFKQAHTGNLASWDEAFGVPWQQPDKQQRRVRTESRQAYVYDLVWEIHRSYGLPIDNDLFERVGRVLGIGGKTTVAELYAQATRAIDAWCAASFPECEPECREDRQSMFKDGWFTAADEAVAWSTAWDNVPRGHDLNCGLVYRPPKK